MGMIGHYRRVSQHTLDSLLEDPSKVRNFLCPKVELSREEALSFDLDKLWYLRTGEPWGDFKLFGPKLSDEDLGVGPARYFTPAKVWEVSRVLAPRSSEQPTARQDTPDIAAEEIDLQLWEDSPENREYYITNCEAARTLFATAAQNGDAIIIWQTK